jgi:hypothetical protein
MDQLNLFDDIYPRKFAVIFFSNCMKDSFGDLWFRKEIYKSNLSEDAALSLCDRLNYSLPSGTSNYYDVIEQKTLNFLIED